MPVQTSTNPPESSILSGCQEGLVGTESLINQTAGQKPPPIEEPANNKSNNKYNNLVINNLKNRMKKRCRCGEDIV